MIFLLAPNNFPLICNVLELPHSLLEPSDPSQRLLAYTKLFSAFDAHVLVAFSSPLNYSQWAAHPEPDIDVCIRPYLALGCVNMSQRLRKTSIAFSPLSQLGSSKVFSLAVL